MLNPNEEFNLPDVEKKVLEFWRQNGIFEKSLSQRKGKKPFVFYEGPPYANGKPGIHHVLARVVKDIILRYKSMQGFYVPRRAGWDTHGLPVEMAAEKALGLKSKKEIEKFGIEHFNDEAKKAVWLYKDEWEQLTERIGYWLDLKNAYVTYTSEYVETLWWTLKKISERKLLYKGHKVVPWCVRCGTSLSSHELAQGYKETTDQSVYLKFQLKKGQEVGGFKTDDKTFVLSWTTTPWTLPGNVALAVGEKIIYAQARLGDETYFVAKDLLRPVLGEAPELVAEIKGKDLVGLSYKPLFNVAELKSETSYKIYPADFVTTTDGTGVVHTAVMYGEDDYVLGKKVGLPQVHTVNEEGRFMEGVTGFEGMAVKAKETEEKILGYLTEKGYLLRILPYVHEYPYCWRCGTPVLYYARNSWFIAMSSLRKELLEANKKINWSPSYLKEGRFGEWIREVKDWNLSRERYWGAPLPIWECKKCGDVEVIGSVAEFSEQSGGAKNKYFMMRHGESENNTKNIIDSGQRKLPLTAKGKKQVELAAKKVAVDLAKKKQKFDLIVYSDVQRATESAKIVAKVLGLKHGESIVDNRLHEVRLGELSGQKVAAYHTAYPTYEEKFEKVPPGGESLRMMRARVWSLLQELEEKHKGKNILFITHEYTVWMLMHAGCAWSEKKAIAEKRAEKNDFIKNGQVRELKLVVAPRNGTGEVDLHRPYADNFHFVCKKCGAKTTRVKEVADVWYDSGAMPYGQLHYPFENSKEIDKGIAYPADYIAEGMDQTRGWFYTLLAVATALGLKGPYKNVVSLGLINDKNGQKMSKSKGNIVNPWEVIDKYGVDAIRWYLYTVSPLGEPKNFDELEIIKIYRKFHMLAYNSFVFLRTYGKKPSAKFVKPKNILDKWIMSRLSETKDTVTKKLDAYEIREAAIALEEFADDMSRWYIRRSRRRLQKQENKKDFADACNTLYFVLVSFTKMASPFMPFFGEALYQGLLSFSGAKKSSVHLADWPIIKWPVDKKLLSQMKEVRDIASLGLAARAEAGIKVRQPLATVWVSEASFKLIGAKNIATILKDEVNVKNVKAKKDLKQGIELDKNITKELKEEGWLRDIVRAVQELRQTADLKSRDSIRLFFDLPEDLRIAAEGNSAFLKKEVGAKAIEFKKTDKFDSESQTKLDGRDVWLALKKV